MNNRNNGMIQQHLSHTGRTREAGPTEVLEESMCGLCPGYNQSFRASFMYTVRPDYLRNQANNSSKRVIARFRGAREKGDMAFVEGLGVPQEDTMEGWLWRKTLGSRNVMEPIGGTYHGDCCRLHAIRCIKTGWSSPPTTESPPARFLCESKVQFVTIEDTWSFQNRGRG